MQNPPRHLSCHLGVDLDALSADTRRQGASNARSLTTGHGGKVGAKEVQQPKREQNPRPRPRDEAVDVAVAAMTSTECANVSG